MNFIDDVGNEVKETSCIDDYDFGVESNNAEITQNKWKILNDNLKNIENSKNAKKGQFSEKQLIRMFESIEDLIDFA